MTKNVLLDQSNVVSRMGTGIATYAKNLARAAGAAGFGVDALLSAQSGIDRKNPILTEVQLYDAPQASSPRATGVWGAIRGGFGYHPVALPAQNTVMRPAGEASPFSRMFAATKLFDQARSYFHVHGRFAKVRLPETPALFHATHPLPIKVPGCPNIVTIHDLVPLRLPYMTLDNKRYFYRLIKAHLAHADHIVTVSEYSRQDIISLFGVAENRISNSYQAVSIPAKLVARPVDMLADLVRNIFDLEWGEYFLFVGALEPKKNVARLIDAYAASGSKKPLVIAGGHGWQNDVEMSRINDPRFSQYRIIENTISRFDRVRRITYLPFEQLIALMQGARALLFPSVFEGFGLPVLEAMALGTPVMTSNVTSLPEVAGDAALLVDPHDTDAMARAIRQLDQDTDLLRSLRAKGIVQAAKFTPDIYRARIEEIYSSVLK
jgi:glycosyltransferase involved in cell wall biosynthesis